jgi:UDP-glucose 4-epimerase
MARNILVTGGAGFIGSHLVERLSTTGRIQVIDNLSRGNRNWLPPETVLHAVDIRSSSDVRRVVSQALPTVVVHLAALHFIPEVDGAPQSAWEVNVEGTKNLLEALVENPPRLFLFASTAAVYQDRQGAMPETCPVEPSDVYGKTKVEGERLVAQFAARAGARCLVARIFNVIGRRETNPHVVPELVGQVRHGSFPVRLGNMDSRRDYTDVIDVAAALAALISAPSAGPTTFNIGSGRGVSVADLVGICEKILGRRISVEFDPSRRRRNDRVELIADISRLSKTVGWSPTRTLEQTLSDLLSEK